MVNEKTPTPEDENTDDTVEIELDKPVELHSLPQPTPVPGQENAKPVEGKKLTIREQVIAKLAEKKEREAEVAAKERLAKATEKQKAVAYIDVDDTNRDLILTMGLESTQRTNASGGIGTMEDRITTLITGTLMQAETAERDDLFETATEMISGRLQPGETWNEEIFYKVWNKIAALGQPDA